MITYNHEQYIADAIQSILNQTLSQFELIIVNDGSTDRTEEIVRSFNDPRIRYIHQKNQGPSSASNTAILAAHAKYVALMSGDDICYPDRLEKQYNFLSSSSHNKVVFSRVNFIDEDNHPVSVRWAENAFNVLHFQSRAALFKHFFFHGNCLNAVTCMVEKELIIEAGLFNLASIQLQDFDMWLKLVKKHELFVLPDRLVKYRFRAKQMNLSSPLNSVRSRFEHYMIAENIFDHVSQDFFKEAFFDEIIQKNFASDAEYELEKAFLFLKNDIPLLKTIGVKKLFHLLQDKRILDVSLRKYKFDLPNLYRLTMTMNIRDNYQMHDDIKQLKDSIQQLQNTIQQIQPLIQNPTPPKTFQLMLKTTIIKIIHYSKRTYQILRYEGFRTFLKKLKHFLYTKYNKFRTAKIPEALRYSTWYTKQLLTRFKRAKDDLQHVLHHKNTPKISIVMPVCDPQPEHLTQALDSVINQFYPHWELCIADDCSSNPEIREILSRYATQDSRIKIMLRSERGHISEASNSALTLVTGDYIGFLDHDDELEQDALYWVAKTIQTHPSAKLIYSDEDHRNPEGELCLPYFKPAWNKDLLLSQNYICHFMVISRSVITQLKGFNSQYNGAQDYDLVLRASELCHDAEIQHIPFVLYHWREHAGSTAMAIGAKPYAMEAGRRAVADHLQRLAILATVLPAPDAPAWNRIRYTIPQPAPLVSIIIPTRNRCDLLKTCIDSIRHADYKNFEILVIDNGSDQPNDLVYLDSIVREKIAKVVRLDIPFNYARLNNLGVQHTSGEILLFMNNDIEAIDTGWLGEIVSNTLRKEIGIVGARLWYPNFTLQHAGVIIGMGGLAGHAFCGLPKGSAGYFGRAVLQQNFSAVTGACMAFRREVFEQVGGFDEIFVVSMNDVDICLRVLQLGLKITWTPFAALIHHESASRGQDDTPEKLAVRMHECALFENRWKDILLTDPAYNPNLSLDSSCFELSPQPRLEKFIHSPHPKSTSSACKIEELA